MTLSVSILLNYFYISCNDIKKNCDDNYLIISVFNIVNFHSGLHLCLHDVLFLRR